MNAPQPTVRFQLTSVDWDQTGGGMPHAVPDLRRQLPLTIEPRRTLPGPDRPDYVAGTLVDRPVVYRPAPDFDWGRTQPEFRRDDERGRVLLVYAVVVVALFQGQQLHAGMRGLAVGVAYVIDNTLGSDEVLDFRKCDHICQGNLTDVTG